MSYIYLASPYSSGLPDGSPADENLRFRRYKEAARAVAWVLTNPVRRLPVYSPIVHCHEMALDHNLPKDAEFWLWYNNAMLASASALFILTLEGWRESEGVQGELEEAIRLKLPVRFINATDRATGPRKYTITKKSLVKVLNSGQPEV